MFRNEATSAPKSIWRSERRCYSNDIITNDARDSYRLLKDCWRIRNQQSNHVFDNDSYRPRDTMIGFYVPESPVAGRFPVALLLVHQQPSLYVVVGVSLSLSLSLSLSRKREGMVGIFMAIRTFFSDLSLSFHDSCETRSRESRFFFTANRTNFRFSDFSENLYTLYTRSREDEDSRQNIGRTTKKRRRNTERWKTRTEDPWTRERKYLEGGRSGRKIERKKGRVGVCERRRDRRKCW